MIKFNVSIVNWRRPSRYRSVYQRSWAVSQHRTLEIEFDRYDYELFAINVDLQWRRRDHAGPEFEINVLGWCARIGLPSNRHWDYEANTWTQHVQSN